MEDAQMSNGDAANLRRKIFVLDSRSDNALMMGFDAAGRRERDPKRRGSVLALQVYLMQNEHSLWDRGQNTVYMARPSEAMEQEEIVEMYKLKSEQQGTILGYVLTEHDTHRELLKVRVHGDSTLTKLLAGFNPNRRYDVENRTLYKDIPSGTRLGTVVDLFPDNRILNPEPSCSHFPRLEMQVAATLGLRYYLAVTGNVEPVGMVASGIIGRFAPRSESYQLTLRNHTREEALLWICVLVATDMKRRKADRLKWRY